MRFVAVSNSKHYLNAEFLLLGEPQAASVNNFIDRDGSGGSKVISHKRVISPVHISQQPSQARREAMQVIPDALDEGVGQRLQLSDDEVPVLLHVLGVLGTSLASKFPETLGRREPETETIGARKIQLIGVGLSVTKWIGPFCQSFAKYGHSIKKSLKILPITK